MSYYSDYFTDETMRIIVNIIRENQRKVLDLGMKFYPEYPLTLLDQLRRVRLGIKPAMLFHRLGRWGIPGVLLNYILRCPELSEFESKEGIFIYNNSIFSKEGIENTTRSPEKIAETLGYGSSYGAEATHTHVLILINRFYVEKEAVSFIMYRIYNTLDTLEKQFEEGDFYKIKTIEDFRAERLAWFNR